MHRGTINYVVDFVTLIVILAMAFTGILLEFVLPPGSGSGAGARSLLDWTRHDWGDVHFYLGCGLAGLVAVHVALHWNWVCTFTRRMLIGRAAAGAISRVRRDAYGIAFVGLLIGVFGGATWLASRYVEVQDGGLGRGARAAAGSPQQARLVGQTRARTEGDDAERAGRNLISGSTTLADAAEMAGVPVEALRRELNVPDDVSADERLGRLRRQYGFTMSDVRRAVDRMANGSSNHPETGETAGEQPS